MRLSLDCSTEGKVCSVILCCTVGIPAESTRVYTLRSVARKPIPPAAVESSEGAHASAGQKGQFFVPHPRALPSFHAHHAPNSCYGAYSFSRRPKLQPSASPPSSTGLTLCTLSCFSSFRSSLFSVFPSIHVNHGTSKGPKDHLTYDNTFWNPPHHVVLVARCCLTFMSATRANRTEYLKLPIPAMYFPLMLMFSPQLHA